MVKRFPQGGKRHKIDFISYNEIQPGRPPWSRRTLGLTYRVSSSECEAFNLLDGKRAFEQVLADSKPMLPPMSC